MGHTVRGYDCTGRDLALVLAMVTPGTAVSRPVHRNVCPSPIVVRSGDTAVDIGTGRW